jgi:hypothetical protein
MSLLTPAVHKREDVRRALEHARDHDPDRLVRKVAGWAAPGGPIFRRLTPQSWVCVLNPSEATFEQVKPMLAEAYQLAAARPNP